MSRSFTKLTALLLLVSAFQPFSPSAFSSDPAFRNPDLPVEQRIDDLISRLTIDEKIGQLMMATPAIPRLGIPAYDWWNEALHGVARNGIATVYPQAIGLAAAWNPGLHQRIADSIATEARAKNNELLRNSKTGDTKRYQGLTIWSPNINIFRDPRWGRGQETYGEDPLLTSELGVAFVRGLQGDDPRYLKTVATIKHYAVHSGPEPLRHRFNAISSARDLWETYLPAFEAGIVEGRAWSLMSAYNAINGIPAPAHRELLTDILRDKWGFEGAVVSDVGGIADVWRPKAHLYSKDAAEASAVTIKAGNELASDKTYEALPDALKRGLITEAEIDTALRRLLKLLFMLGQFDPPERVPYRSIPISENDSPAHDALALEAARQSLVLLKNDGVLPLDAKKLAGKTVAILGPAGFEESTILGNYAGTPSRKITLVDGIRAKLESKGARVLAEPAVPLVKGFRVTGDAIPDGVLFTDATRATPGLKAEIFSNEKQDSKKPNLVGKLVATQTQTQIDLQWDETQPAGDIPITHASIRWTGVMIPKVTGEYTLGVVSEGALRLHIDDKRVIDFWRRDAERPLSTTITLNAGQTYDIRIEYVQLTRKGRVQLGWIAPGNNNAHDRAMAAARAADRIILTLGITPDLEGESMTVTAEGFTGGDRLTIQLPETQRALLDEIAALKKPTILVLTGGAAIAFDDTKANAALFAWYYGQRGADAVAEALLGETNPAGRLPVTFYKNDSDLPPFEDYSMANRTYKYFTGKPLYAFGHGLSYTIFEYQNIALKTNATGDITAKVTIKNIGARDGDEVVQIYATAKNAPVPMPLRQLVGFKRVTFKAGETKTLEFTIPAARLRRWDETNKCYTVDSGEWRFAAGPASDRLPLAATLKLLCGASAATSPAPIAADIDELPLGPKSNDRRGVFDFPHTGEPPMPVVKPLFDTRIRDTSVCVGPDGTYYLTGTTGENIWESNEGIHLWKSTDLKNWELIGLVWSIERDGTWQKQWTEKNGRRRRAVWAPEVHFIKGNFYLAYCITGLGTGVLKSATGKPEGPYRSINTPDAPLTRGIDASLFEDDDGSVYFLHGSGYLARLNDDLSGLAETPARLRCEPADSDIEHHHPNRPCLEHDHIGYEGTAIFKRNGRYYLSGAERYYERYHCMVAESENIRGPYAARYVGVPYAGHNNFFRDNDGNWWATIFGNDKQAPFRERPGILRVEFDAAGRVRPLVGDAAPYNPPSKRK